MAFPFSVPFLFFSHSAGPSSRMADACDTHLALALATPPWPSPRRRQPCSTVLQQEGAAELAAREGDEEEDADVRKKIRLTKEQSAMLEIRFRLQSNLTSKQKQALAKKLNLQPRQVEVWFQNRRARKKLKQTEIDREFLKKRYEELSKENQMLQKELQDMKALELPAAGLSVCPTCGKISGGDAAALV
ncbi:homeobox-leucine zipper protein HAT22-like [Zingiber officinale]|uniref:homeobox-leucine zipper protein HAT22-like n=1 Tax=Zingiber officinale TaxID=94328 RepID=UPI001C4DAFB9|nr:homeobox-leucine zipper protein HAT22-like [Zingiber officinale]